MALGPFIRRARRYQRLSLTKLAARVHVSTSYLCRIERGAPGRKASDQLLRKLARELCLPVDDVFVSAGRLAPDMVKWLTRHPLAIDAVRTQMRGEKSDRS